MRPNARLDVGRHHVGYGLFFSFFVLLVVGAARRQEPQTDGHAKCGHLSEFFAWCFFGDHTLQLQCFDLLEEFNAFFRNMFTILNDVIFNQCVFE